MAPVQEEKPIRQSARIAARAAAQPKPEEKKAKASPKGSAGSKKTKAPPKQSVGVKKAKAPPKRSPASKKQQVAAAATFSSQGVQVSPRFARDVLKSPKLLEIVYPGVQLSPRGPSPGQAAVGQPPAVQAPAAQAPIGEAPAARNHKHWQIKPPITQPRGLSNLGNTCFVNAVLQCLVHSSEFCDYIANIHPAETCPTESRVCLVCALKALISDYQSDRDLKPALQKFLGALRRTLPKDHELREPVIRGRQCDSYLFLDFLLGRLKQAEWPNDPFRADDLFAVHHASEWKCRGCTKLHGNDKDESGQTFGISVDVAAHEDTPDYVQSLYTQLRDCNYVQKLEIECDKARGCLAAKKAFIRKNGEKVKDPSQMRTRRLFITHAPEVLIIKLERVGFDENWQPRKKTDKVFFDEYLNLSEFARSKRLLLYKLQSVVAHAGQTANLGHYIASVRTVEGTQYATINDNAAVQIDSSIDRLHQPKSSKMEFEPYLLFYSKVDTEGKLD